MGPPECYLITHVRTVQISLGVTYGNIRLSLSNLHSNEAAIAIFASAYGNSGPASALPASIWPSPYPLPEGALHNKSVLGLLIGSLSMAGALGLRGHGRSAGDRRPRGSTRLARPGDPRWS